MPAERAGGRVRRVDPVGLCVHPVRFRVTPGEQRQVAELDVRDGAARVLFDRIQKGRPGLACAPKVHQRMPGADEGPRGILPAAPEGAAQLQGPPVRGARLADAPGHLHAASPHDERDGLLDHMPVQDCKEDGIGRPARPDVEGDAERERVDVGMPLAEHGAEPALAARVEPPRQGGQPALGRHFPDDLYAQVAAHRRINARPGHAGIRPKVLYAHGDRPAPSLRLDVQLCRPLDGLFHHGRRVDDYGPPYAQVCAARVCAVLARPDYDDMQALLYHVRRDRKPVPSGHAGARHRRYLCILPASTPRGPETRRRRPRRGGRPGRAGSPLRAALASSPAGAPSGPTAGDPACLLRIHSRDAYADARAQAAKPAANSGRLRGA